MPNEKSALHLGLGYLYVLLAGVAAVFSGFMVRDVYRFALIRAELHRYTIHVNVLFITVAIGTASLIALVVLEHYFRNAADKQTQLLRLLRVLAFPFLMAAVAHLLHGGLALFGAQFLDPFRLAAALVELVLGVSLLVFTGGRLQGLP